MMTLTVDSVAGVLWPAFLVLLRVGAMVSLLPAFGERSVPARVRLGLAAAFTAIVLPVVAPTIKDVPDDVWPALALGAPEVVTGLFFGLLLRLFVIALQTAGTIAAQATSLAQIFGSGPGAEPQPALGNVFVVAGLALAAMGGLHVEAARYMIGGYALIPVGAVPSPGVVAEAGVAAVAMTFGLAFSLAAPFVIASFAYNLILGVINRAMPQLMVAFVGAPAITGGSLILLALATPYLLTVWVAALTGFMEAPFGGGP